MFSINSKGDSWAIILRNIKRQLLLIKRFYKFSGNLRRLNCAVFMVDGRHYHGGLTDRLKGIVSIYAYAKSAGIPFRIHFVYPFKLESFLEPNRYDWRIEDKEITYNLLISNPIILFSELNGKRMFRLNKKRQHHFYLNRDITPAINHHYGNDYGFAMLFNELFRPTPLLQEAVRTHKDRIGGEYYTIVFRFQQLLNDFSEGSFEILPTEERKILIEKCLSAVRNISEDLGNPKILVTSDSRTFLEIVKDLPNVFILPGKLSHMEFPQRDEDTPVHLKSFLDLMMIAGSKKVYSVLVEGYRMYPTEFPKYAAIIGNKPFERIIV